MLLEENVAIVTGAGTGIGQALCAGLANEGARIVITYRNSRTGAEKTLEEVRRTGSDGILVQCDLAKPEDITRLVDEAYKKYGRIDILINNAAERGTAMLLEDACTEENWEYTMNINVRSAFLAAKAVAPIMLEQKRGRIINITSIQGYRPGMMQRIAYQTSKTALESLTLSLSAELSPHGITVNAVAPGSFDTQTIIDTFPPEYFEKRNRWIPLRRGGKLSEMVGPVLFLASGMCDYVSGQSFLADGGWAVTD